VNESLFRISLEIKIVEAGGLRALAAQIGCSPAHLSDVRNGRRRPGPAVLGPLGYVGTWSYVIERRESGKGEATNG
jgi:hypothetical protein